MRYLVSLLCYDCERAETSEVWLDNDRLKAKIGCVRCGETLWVPLVYTHATCNINHPTEVWDTEEQAQYYQCPEPKIYVNILLLT